MVDPKFGEVEDMILEALEETYVVLGEFGVDVVEVSAEEFYDYLTGETFTGDKTTLGNILGSLYYVVHEVVEIGELKRAGLRIGRRTVVDSPRELIYAAHFRAYGVELEAALGRGDVEWVRIRVGNHYRNLVGDEFMPESLRGEAEALYERFRAFHVG